MAVQWLSDQHRIERSGRACPLGRAREFRRCVTSARWHNDSLCARQRAIRSHAAKFDEAKILLKRSNSHLIKVTPQHEPTSQLNMNGSPCPTPTIPL